MVRVVFFLLCGLFPLVVSAASTGEIDEFLNSRQVVTQIFFAKRTAELSSQAKAQIDNIASELQGYQERKMLLRVEGYASPEGGDVQNFQLSLQRSLAVGNYLLSRHKLSVAVFLTGFGKNEKAAGKLSEMRRVDIAIYRKNSAAEALFDNTGKIERFILQ